MIRKVAVKMGTAPPITWLVPVVDFIPTATAPMGEPDGSMDVTAGLYRFEPDPDVYVKTLVSQNSLMPQVTSAYAVARAWT